jgi:hypothetical protein
MSATKASSSLEATTPCLRRAAVLAALAAIPTAAPASRVSIPVASIRLTFLGIMSVRALNPGAMQQQGRDCAEHKHYEQGFRDPGPSRHDFSKTHDISKT